LERYNKKFNLKENSIIDFKIYGFVEIDKITWEHTFLPVRIIIIPNYGWVLQKYTSNWKRVHYSATFQIHDIKRFIDILTNLNPI
jgi:hypothetical protein